VAPRRFTKKAEGTVARIISFGIVGMVNEVTADDLTVTTDVSDVAVPSFQAISASNVM
jgi:hypothetical protein